MPAFKLGDQFGFSLDVVPDPQSGIAKYFQLLRVVVANVDGAAQRADGGGCRRSSFERRGNTR